MNITYMLGNGFDIGLDLKSGYMNFYPYFIEKASKDNIIKSEIEKDKKDNYPNWSDLEVALGKFTKSVSAEDISKFVRDKVELDILLKQYLLEEEKKLVYDDARIKNMIKKALEHMRVGNSIEEKERIEKTLNAYLGESYIYQCITFNYTNCADKIWQSVAKERVGSHTYQGSTKNEQFGTVLHIHGTLEDNEMLIGVNDETQIENSELLDNELVRWALIKPYLNKAIGQRKIERAREIIDKSGIICLYGLSIGITDNIWWEYIGEWLKKQGNHLLIIYNYDPKYSLRHPVTQLMHAEEMRNEFLKNTKLDDNDKKNVKSRIIVYDNQNVFSAKQ